MKKVLCVMVITIAMLFVGCGNISKVNKVNDVAAANDSMFIEVERSMSWIIVYHRETKVMYAVSDGSYNHGTFTVLLDSDGYPLLWKE